MLIIEDPTVAVKCSSAAIKKKCSFTLICVLGENWIEFLVHLQLCFFLLLYNTSSCHYWNRRCRDRMVVGFTTTFAISAYHH